ncbi:Hypothetical predicted protein [Paramuricea clavata]|uniref:Uncharacterized protein n=1 Tax=Paramuricea clavata TaxID=317549 RepID=A0A6S7FN11_PARCT|nr:Hypothetical predicted protein [Paramuricea clavata]
MKRTKQEAEPIEEHDSGFVGPMTLFDTFPHNDTFAETRSLELLPNPLTDNAEIYTFMHNRQDYGVIDMVDAKISADIKIAVAGTGAAPAGDRNIAVNIAPLRYGWKTKAVYLNNQLITPQSSKENELEYIHDFLTTVPSEYKDDQDITLMIRDTPGAASDDPTNLHRNANATGSVNLGARARYVLVNTDVVHECRDKCDLLGRVKRYVPTSFDIKLVLTKLDKTKLLYGTAAHCALVELRLNNLKLSMPILKPNAQLSSAINDLMIQKGEECRYYKITHRYLAIPIPANSRHIVHKDLFNGARPTRLITKIISQDRYNGSHILAPYKAGFPNITRFAVSINEAEIPPVITSATDAYINLRQVLDRRYSEMPCNFADYKSDFGMIVTDLSPNRDGYSQVLPNATSGNISIKIDFRNDTAAAQQLFIMKCCRKRKRRSKKQKGVKKRSQKGGWNHKKWEKTTLKLAQIGSGPRKQRGGGDFWKTFGKVANDTRPRKRDFYNQKGGFGYMDPQKWAKDIAGD